MLLRPSWPSGEKGAVEPPPARWPERLFTMRAACVPDMGYTDRATFGKQGNMLSHKTLAGLVELRSWQSVKNLDGGWERSA